jgi:hypothetical protein
MVKWMFTHQADVAGVDSSQNARIKALEKMP